MMAANSRRRFLASAALGAAAVAAPAVVRGRNLNERLRVAVVGMGGRAAAHAHALAELEKDPAYGVELAGVCDCDTTKLGSAVNVWGKTTGHEVTGYDDLRRVLDDRSIDAVAYATPNHWHALGVIWACQAGKDAYVEKPGSHTIFEGRKMVEAARKYGRIVQHGTQCRSSANIIEGIEKLHEGVIGDVYFARGIAYKIRPGHGKRVPEPAPKGLDWSAWCGPAALRDFSTFDQKKWHWVWDFGNGEIGNQGVHQMDIIRWGLKLDTHPSTISSMGTNFMQQFVHKSDAETPGTQSAMFKWGDRKMVEFEVRDWYTNSEAGFRDQYPFVQKNFPVGVIFLGTNGTMIFPDYSSYRTFIGPRREEGPSAYAEGSPISDLAHFQNWIRAIRSRKSSDLSADIQEGHLSSALCHLANIAYRVDRTVHFDSDAETFVGDADADKLLTRSERPGFTVPTDV